MAGVLSPFVYWGQNNEKIFLKVDLKDVKDADVEIEEDGVKFKGSGHGCKGRNNYGFSLEFYLPIDADASKYRVMDSHVEFQVKKVGVGEFWPRLTVNQKKPAWLKIDFDHFSFEDSAEENQDDLDELQNKQAERDMMEKIERDIMEAENSAFPDLKTAYLFLFNMFQWVGFCYVFIVLVFRYLRDGEEIKSKAFEVVGAQLIVVQLVACLEVLHPLVGLVKTGIFMPLIQVFGRNMVLFGLIATEPKLQERGVVWYLFLTWSAVELVRYPFYIVSSFKINWSPLTWLRYSIWIPLYPLGFMFEGFVMLLALPYFENTGKWSVSLPNEYNCSFHFPTFLRIYMCLFLIGAYILMKRMYEQRKKRLTTSRPRKIGSKVKTKVKKR